MEKKENVFECSCGHCNHNDEKNHLNSEKSCFFIENLWVFIRLFSAIVLVVIGQLIKEYEILSFCLHLFSFVAVGYPIFINVIKGFFKKKFLTENTLMVMASVVCLFLNELLESVLILALFTVGELLESFSINSARAKIGGLAKLKEEKCRVITKSGVSLLEPSDVEVGSLIEIRRGERILVDCVLLDANAWLDFKALTGESQTIKKKCGDELLSGCINVGDSIVVKTIRKYCDSEVSKILEMVEGGLSKKAKSQKFISSFAKIYTPIVVLCGLIISLIPPLFDNYNFVKWIYKGLSFIVISCPCSLVISIPLCFFMGLGALAKEGVLIKGSKYIEILSKTNVAVFDKTGTLTVGKMQVEEVFKYGSYSIDEIISYAKALEKSSSHPIAQAILQHDKCKIEAYQATEIKEIEGKGLLGKINNENVMLGNKNLLVENGVEVNYIEETGITVFLAIKKKLVGVILLNDLIKPNAKTVIEKLKKDGINNTIMLSGDNENVAKNVGESIGVDNVYSNLLPQDKYKKLNMIKESGKNKVIYVGDGINDAPALSCADVGIAMGMLGSDVAMEAGDVSILNDNLLNIFTARKHSKKIMKVVIENILFSLGLKFSIMILTIFINLPVFIATLGDVGVLLLAIINSLRCYKLKKSA